MEWATVQEALWVMAARHVALQSACRVIRDPVARAPESQCDVTSSLPLWNTPLRPHLGPQSYAKKVRKETSHAGNICDVINMKGRDYELQEVLWSIVATNLLTTLLYEEGLAWVAAYVRINSYNRMRHLGNHAVLIITEKWQNITPNVGVCG
jgi:hypothetical protein